MFADSLLEVSWAERGRRSCTTLTSFGLQAVIIGLLLMIPLLTTVGSPLARTVSTPITMGRRSPRPAAKPHESMARNPGVQIIPYTGPIMEPRRINHGITPDDGKSIVEDFGGPPQIGIGTYGGGDSDLPSSIAGNRSVPIPPPPKPATPVFKRSEILEGMLIRKVEPKYPPLAITARIQGSVVLAAVISKNGEIENLRLVSGQPMLVRSAIEAVSQWRYRPFILNGEVIEVETQFTVNFVLGR